MTSMASLTDRIVLRAIAKWRTRSFENNFSRSVDIAPTRTFLSNVMQEIVERYASGQWFVRTVNLPYRPVIKDCDLRHYDIDFYAERWMMVDAVHLRQESGIRKCLFLPKYKRSQITLYKITVDIIRYNYISENGKTQKHNEVNSKRDGRLQLRPNLIAIAGATQ